MQSLFEELDCILKEMPDSNSYINGGCDAVALGISDFVLKHVPKLIPVYVIISRVTYDHDGNVVDDNDCSHIVVGFKETYNSNYVTWDAYGKQAYENWENNWFNEPESVTDFFIHEYYSETKLINTLYKGKNPMKDTPYDAIIRRTIFDYLEFQYLNYPTSSITIEPTL